jgi:class 3 adenylate cyclase
MNEQYGEENILALTEALAMRKAASSNLRVNAILDDQHGRARKDLQEPVEIENVDTFPKLTDLYVDKRKWLRVRNVVAVSADLKSSTALSFNKYAQTSARLYEAATGSAVRLMAKFDPEFMDIQGDGIFGLFHGERAFERALCAGITLKSFSVRSLEPMIEELFAEGFPDTGFKVGMSAGVLVAKKVGVRGTNEPVWAGKPVNYAVKCAGKADRHQLIATANVYERFAGNDYVTHSCGCPDSLARPLWVDIEVEKLDKHSQCKLLPVGWCTKHGDEFCAAILDGKRKRDDVSGRIAA